MKSLPLALLLLVFAAPCVFAADAKPSPAAAAKDPRVELAAKIPGTKPEDLRPTPIPGLFEISSGLDVSYVSSDGKYILRGDLFQIEGGGADFPNLTEQRRMAMRRDAMAKLSESEMVVFGPAKAPYTITVFTDMDCSWCRRLHSQMAEYNKLGVRVRYLFFPRSGPDTESWYKAESVYCAKDRKAALTKSKAGEKLPKANCGATPVRAQFDLGRELGVRGTPGVLLPSGELVPGYLPPGELIAYLKQTPGQVAKAP
jgi:thiol:disulfide interchange protein DsbC